MVERFLRYSLENERKICAVLALEDGLRRTNLQVTSIDGDGFTARLPGRKRDIRFALGDVLTASYARGDKGELEELE